MNGKQLHDLLMEMDETERGNHEILVQQGEGEPRPIASARWVTEFGENGRKHQVVLRTATGNRPRQNKEEIGAAKQAQDQKKPVTKAAVPGVAQVP